MFTYDNFVEACKNVGLDPFVKRPSKVEYIRLDTKGRFDLEKIDFPSFYLEQVLRIGEIIQNLNSQMNITFQFNLTNEEGKKEYERDKAIGKILPILKDSQEFWLNKGLKDVKSKVNVVAHCGVIYELDPEYGKKMNKFEEDIRKSHRDSANKLRISENLANKF